MASSFFKIAERACLLMAVVLFESGRFVQSGKTHPEKNADNEETDLKINFHLSSGLYRYNLVNDELRYGPHNLYDGDLNTNVDSGSCFHSHSNDGHDYKAWVALSSDEAMFITKVDILNRRSDYKSARERIRGLKVKICNDPSFKTLSYVKPSTKSCKEFGTVTEAPNGNWVHLSNNSMKFEGATVLLEHTTTISICEVKVKGKKLH